MERYFPINISTTGGYIDSLFGLATILILIAFVAVLAILIGFSIAYRDRPGHKAFYTHGNSRKALYLTLSLAIAVFILIDVNLAFHDHKAWDAIWGNPPNPEESTLVQVMPEQFAWNIRYAGPDKKFATADDIVTINFMHIPVNKPVIVQLKSKDVIHSFFLPNIRIKQDAVPGMITSLYFEANTEGSFNIACAEHCGLGHYRMQGFLVVESEEKFEEWLVSESQEGYADPGWGWDWNS